MFHFNYDPSCRKYSISWDHFKLADLIPEIIMSEEVMCDELVSKAVASLDLLDDNTLGKIAKAKPFRGNDIEVALANRLRSHAFELMEERKPKKPETLRINKDHATFLENWTWIAALIQCVIDDEPISDQVRGKIKEIYQ